MLARQLRIAEIDADDVHRVEHAVLVRYVDVLQLQTCMIGENSVNTVHKHRWLGKVQYSNLAQLWFHLYVGAR